MRMVLGLSRLGGDGWGGTYAPYAFAFDAKNGWYKGSDGVLRTDPTALPGYSYTRSGAKSEVSSGGVIYPFAANVPGIVPGEGYWSRAALTNFILRSDNFNSGTWAKANCSAVVDAVSPDGLLRGSTITATAGTAVTKVSQNYAGGTAGTTYAISVFIRSGDFRYAWVGDRGDASMHSATFDLLTGAVVGSSNLVSASIASGSWGHRVIIVFTRTNTAAIGYNIAFGDAAHTADNPSVTVVGTDKLVVWEAGLVVGTQPGPVINTVAATATVGSDLLTCSQPISADEDFIFISKVSFPVAVNAADELVAAIGVGTGTNGRISLFRKATVGTLSVNAPNGAAREIQGQVHTTGDAVLLFRRRSGANSLGTKTGGVVAISSETALAFPSPIVNTMCVGVHGPTGGIQANAIVQNVLVRRGTFSDTEITNILQAA